jgi:hypothetical protein
VGDVWAGHYVGVAVIGLLSSASRMAAMTGDAPDKRAWMIVNYAAQEEDETRFRTLMKALLLEIDNLTAVKDPRYTAALSIAKAVRNCNDSVYRMRRTLGAALAVRAGRATARDVEAEHGFVTRVLPLRQLSIHGITLRGKASTFTRKMATRVKALARGKLWEKLTTKIEEMTGAAVENRRGLNSGKDQYISEHKGLVDWDGERGGTGDAGRRKGKGAMRGVSELNRQWKSLSDPEKQRWVKRWEEKENEKQKDRISKLVKRAKVASGGIRLTAETEEELMGRIRKAAKEEYVGNTYAKYSPHQGVPHTSLRQYCKVFNDGFETDEFARCHAGKVILESETESANKICRAVCSIHKVLARRKDEKEKAKQAKAKVQAGEGGEDAEGQGVKVTKKMDVRQVLLDAGVLEEFVEEVEGVLANSQVLICRWAETVEELPLAQLHLISACSYSPMAFSGIPLEGGQGEGVDIHPLYLPKSFATSDVFDSEANYDSLLGQACEIFAGDIGWVVEVPWRCGLGMVGVERVVEVAEGVQEIFREVKPKGVRLNAGGQGEDAAGEEEQKVKDATEQIRVRMNERTKAAADYSIRCDLCKHFYSIEND